VASLTHVRRENQLWCVHVSFGGRVGVGGRPRIADGPSDAIHTDTSRHSARSISSICLARRQRLAVRYRPDVAAPKAGQSNAEQCEACLTRPSADLPPATDPAAIVDVARVGAVQQRQRPHQDERDDDDCDSHNPRMPEGEPLAQIKL
jgi:hypothetical protein